jgi:predicted MPP superfamily phosphohydrolase
MKNRSIWVLVALLSAFLYYFCHQIFAYAGFPYLEKDFGVLGLSIMVFSIAMMPILFWSRPHLREKRFFNGFLIFIYFSLSYLSYLLCLVVLRDLVHLLAWPMGVAWFQYSRIEAQAILILPIIFTGIGAWLAHRGPRIKKVVIANPKYQGPAHYRIVQISDLHIGPSVGSNAVQRVVDRANALCGNAVVLTGDIFDGNPEQFPGAIESLRSLMAADGIFFIPGNHEYFHDFDRALETAQKLGFRVLINDFQPVAGGNILLGGVPDRMARFLGKTPEDAPGLAARMRAVDSGRAYWILLEHQPHQADRNSQLGFDLQLSGHTHDGQFFPWTWVVRLIQKYARGLYVLGPMHLYVNPGTMYWGPPNRFGPSSEITAIELSS